MQNTILACHFFTKTSDILIVHCSYIDSRQVFLSASPLELPAHDSDLKVRQADVKLLDSIYVEPVMPDMEASANERHLLVEIKQSTPEKSALSMVYPTVQHSNTHFLPRRDQCLSASRHQKLTETSKQTLGGAAPVGRELMSKSLENGSSPHKGYHKCSKCFNEDAYLTT